MSYSRVPQVPIGAAISLSTSTPVITAANVSPQLKLALTQSTAPASTSSGGASFVASLLAPAKKVLQQAATIADAAKTAQMQAASKQAAATARATATKPGQVYNGPSVAQMQEASKLAAATARATATKPGQVYNGPSATEAASAPTEYLTAPATSGGSGKWWLLGGLFALIAGGTTWALTRKHSGMAANGRRR